MEMEAEPMESTDAEDAESTRSCPTAAPAPLEGGTFLRPAFATSISITTSAALHVLRAARVVGSVPFKTTKHTTLAGLELVRHSCDTLTDAARNGAVRYSGTLVGKLVADPIYSQLDSSNRMITSAKVFATSGFQAVGSATSSLFYSWEVGLALIHGALGSTESSRALRGIFDFLRKEFHHPAHQYGQQVGSMDIFVALLTLASLQVKCRALDAQECGSLQVEAVVWDVVLTGTNPAEVPGASIVSMDGKIYRQGPPGIERAEEASDTFKDAYATGSGGGQILKIHLANDFPLDASAAGCSTITIETDGKRPPRIDAPPGWELVEGDDDVSQGGLFRAGGALPDDGNESKRIYQTVLRLRKEGEGTDSDQFDCTDDEISLKAEEQTLEKPSGDATEKPPPVPPKSPSTKEEPRAASSPTTSPLPTSRLPCSSLPSQPSATAAREQSVGSQTIPPPSKSGQKKAGPRTPSPRPSKPENRPARKLSFDIGPAKTPKPKGVQPRKVNEKRGGLRSAIRKAVLHRDEASSVKAKQLGPVAAESPATGKSHAVTATAYRLPAPAAPLRQSSLSMIPKRAAAPPPSRQAPRSQEPAVTRETASTRARPPSQPMSPAAAARVADVKRLSLTMLHPEYDRNASSPELPLTRSRPSTRESMRATTPSIYTLRTSESQSSFEVVPYFLRSAYNNAEGFMKLQRTGVLDGTFPAGRLSYNLARYMRFSSASYGSNFLNNWMGIAAGNATKRVDFVANREVQWFAAHTGLQPRDILVCSFTDAQGGSDRTGSTNTGVPLHHYIALDHDAKAVVLACRGTLGFEDLLADLACDYDDLVWQGAAYRVHKGVHASARRLLYGGDGKVLATIKQALETNPEYGLILCGHSLGAAVTALLGVMLSMPGRDAFSPAFVTSDELQPAQPPTDGNAEDTSAVPLPLPVGRPIHVFAYGPPGTMCAPLCKNTKGLITSIVHGNDVVPSLSLGLLHDLQAVAVDFRPADPGFDSLFRTAADLGMGFYNNVSHLAKMTTGVGLVGAVSGDGSDVEAYTELKMLRATMLSTKLLPPGEVLTVERFRVLQRLGYTQNQPMPQAAERVVLKHVRNPEWRFREIRISSGMIGDHNPTAYEHALNALDKVLSMVQD